MLDKLLGSKQFREEFRGLLLQAQNEAAARGAAAIEAEHLLLAMATVPFGSASRVLEALHVSPGRITEALDRERARTLAAVGVDTRRLPHPRPMHDSRRLRWGQSARLAAERSTREDHPDAQVRMLLAIVRAERGVIPRLLAELHLTTMEFEDAVTAQ